MSRFSRLGFLVGITSIVVYRTNMVPVLFRMLKTKLEGTTTTATKSDNFSLLHIDLSTVEDNFEEAAKQLVFNFEKIGFAAVHGIQDFDSDELLHWTKWFFYLPLERKMAIAKKAFNSTSSSIYRGYYPVVPGTHSFKEAYETGIFNEGGPLVRGGRSAADIRNTTTSGDGRPYMRNLFREKNVFPLSDVEEEDEMFAEVMKKYYQIYRNVGDTIFQLMCVGLGFERHQFEYKLGEEQSSTLRLLHYPSRLHDVASIPADAWDGKTPIVTGAHHDTSVITVLATFNMSGLQIKPPGYKKWIDIKVDKNSLVINIGAMLSSLVEGRMIATNHRVVDTGVDRYSVPFFSEFAFDADVRTTFYGRKNDFVGTFERYGPWAANLTSQFYKYATTDFGIVD